MKIVFVLHRSNEHLTYFTSNIFKKTLFNNNDFKDEYPLDDTLVNNYMIDNNSIWGQMSAHFRLFYNLDSKYEIIGFGQYRRTFKSKNPIRSFLRLPLSCREINKYLAQKDAIITQYYIPPQKDTAFERFDFYEGGSAQIISIILELFPQFKNTIEEMEKIPGAFWNGPNIIAKKETLFTYYQYLIPFLLKTYEFFKSLDSNYIIKKRARYMDFCAELFLRYIGMTNTRVKTIYSNCHIFNIKIFYGLNSIRNKK